MKTKTLIISDYPFASLRATEEWHLELKCTFLLRHRLTAPRTVVPLSRCWTCCYRLPPSSPWCHWAPSSCHLRIAGSPSRTIDIMRLCATPGHCSLVDDGWGGGIGSPGLWWWVLVVVAHAVGHWAIDTACLCAAPGPLGPVDSGCKENWPLQASHRQISRSSVY